MLLGDFNTKVESTFDLIICFPVKVFLKMYNFS